MPEPVLCKICQKRRARRFCPAVSGDICTICCGTEREVSLTCPLNCQYLEEAHKREKPVDVPTAEVSYPDIRVSEEFLRQHEELLLFSLYSLLQAALRTPGAHDSDVISALEALIQTQRTLASGLFYETRPENTVALGIHRLFVASLDDYRKERQEHETSSELRDSEVLALLVFVLRLAQQNQNGKPRCRSFMDLLRHLTPDEGRVAEQTSSIII